MSKTVKCAICTTNFVLPGPCPIDGYVYDNNERPIKETINGETFKWTHMSDADWTRGLYAIWSVVNPLRLKHDVMRWNGGTVPTLARQALDDRSLVPVLLDALSDAGASDVVVNAFRASHHTKLPNLLLDRWCNMTIEELTQELVNRFPEDPSAPGVLVAHIREKQLYYVSAQRFTQPFGQGRTIVAKGEGPTLDDALRALVRNLES